LYDQNQSLNLLTDNNHFSLPFVRCDDYFVLIPKQNRILLYANKLTTFVAKILAVFCAADIRIVEIMILIGLQNFTKLRTLLVIVYTQLKTVLKRSSITY